MLREAACSVCLLAFRRPTGRLHFNRPFARSLGLSAWPGASVTPSLSNLALLPALVGQCLEIPEK